jgi:hypothetical protein
LRGYCDILDELDVNAHGHLLVIFATAEKAPEKSIKWRYYLHAGSEFIQIVPGVPLIDA